MSRLNVDFPLRGSQDPIRGAIVQMQARSARLHIGPCGGQTGRQDGKFTKGALNPQLESSQLA